MNTTSAGFMFFHLYLTVQFIKIQNQVLGTYDLYLNGMSNKLSSKDENPSQDQTHFLTHSVEGYMICSDWQKE